MLRLIEKEGSLRKQSVVSYLESLIWESGSLGPCRPRPRDHRDAQKGVLLRPADGGVGWAAARFFPTKALRRLKPHNNSVPTEEGAKPGLAGLFYLLEESFFSSQRTKIAQFIMPCLPLLPPTL